MKLLLLPSLKKKYASRQIFLHMQTESKKHYFFALIFGYVGLFLCVLGMIFVVVSSRKVDNSNKKIFATLNEILETVEERKNEVRVRFDITVKTVISVKEKLEELLILLSQADQWMELSQSSLQVVNQAIELANSSGASIETTLTKKSTPFHPSPIPSTAISSSSPQKQIPSSYC